jgi:DNA-binding transcriptional MerR regulator
MVTMGSDPILPKAFYAIGEVADLAGVKPHVLRYWESQIPALQPRKNRAGKRVYRPEEVALVLQVRHLLYEEKLTLDGVKRRLSEGHALEADDPVAQAMVSSEVLRGLREELEALRALLDPAVSFGAERIQRPTRVEGGGRGRSLPTERLRPPAELKRDDQDDPDPFPQLQLHMDDEG